MRNYKLNKIIDLKTENNKKRLIILAARSGKDLKNWIQDTLEQLAKKVRL